MRLWCLWCVLNAAAAAAAAPRVWFASEIGLHSCEADGADLVLHQEWGALAGQCGLASRGLSVDEDLGVALVTCGRKLYRLDVGAVGAGFEEVDLGTTYSMYGVGVDEALHVAYVAVLESVDGWVVKATYLGNCGALPDAACKKTGGCVWQPDRGGCLATKRDNLMAVGSDPYGGGLYVDRAGVAWLSMGEGPGSGAVISRQERTFIPAPNVNLVYDNAADPDLLDPAAPVYVNKTVFMSFQTTEDAVSTLYKINADGAVPFHNHLPLFKGYITGTGGGGATASPNYAIVDESVILYVDGANIRRQASLPCVTDPCALAPETVVALGAQVGVLFYRTPEGPPPTPEPTPEPGPTAAPLTDAPTTAPPNPLPFTPSPLGTAAPTDASTTAPPNPLPFTPSPLGTPAPPVTGTPGPNGTDGSSLSPSPPPPPTATTTTTTATPIAPLPPVPLGGSPAPPVTVYVPVPGENGTSGPSVAAEDEADGGASGLLVILSIVMIVAVLIGGGVFAFLKRRRKERAEDGGGGEPMVDAEREEPEEPEEPMEDESFIKSVKLDKSVESAVSIEADGRLGFNPLAGFNEAANMTVQSDDPAAQTKRGKKTKAGRRASNPLPGRRRQPHLVDADKSDIQNRLQMSNAALNRSGGRRSITPGKEASPSPPTPAGLQRRGRRVSLVSLGGTTSSLPSTTPQRRSSVSKGPRTSPSMIGSNDPHFNNT